MAYKPTRSQQIGVQPLGIVPSSGTRNLAQTFNNISKTLDREMSKDREMLFNEAVLDAQAAGINSVQFDEKGKLVPLTNAEYNPNLFYKADEGRVKNVFEDYLRSSYKTAFNVDVTNAAEKAFDENQNNPDAILAIKEEYKESVDNLPEVLKQGVMPNFEMAFSKAHSSARANVQKLALEKEKSIYVERLNQIFSSMSESFHISGVSSQLVDETIFEDSITQINEIKSNLKRIMPATQVDSLVNNYMTVLQTRALKSHITKYFDDNGAADTFQYIQDLSPKLYNLKGLASGIDSEKVYDELWNHTSRLSAIQNNIRNDVTHKNSQLGSSLDADILNGSIASLEDFNAHPSSIAIQDNIENHGLGQSLINHFTRVFENKMKSNEVDAKSIAVKSFQQGFAVLFNQATNINNTFPSDMTEISKVLGEATILYNEAQNKGMAFNLMPIYNSIKSQHQKAFLNLAKSNKDNAIFNLMNEIENTNNYSFTPQFLLSEEFEKSMFDDTGFKFGTNPDNIMSKKQWRDYVKNYAVGFNKHRENINELSLAWDLSKHGPLQKGTKHHKTLVDNVLNADLSFSDSTGEQKSVPINIAIDVSPELQETNPQKWNENVFIKNQSIKEAIRRSIATKILHPQLEHSFGTFSMSSKEGFAESKALYSSFLSVLREDNPFGEKHKDILGQMFENAGIGLNWFEAASMLPYDAFMEAMNGSRSSQGSYNNMFRDEEGERFEDVFNSSLNALFQEESLMGKVKNWTGWSVETIDPYHKAMARQLINEANNMKPAYGWLSLGPMIDVATIKSYDVAMHPIVNQVLKDIVKGKMTSGKYNAVTFNENPQKVMTAMIGDALDSMGSGNIGMVVQGDGNLYIEKHPFLKYAKQSAGGYPVNITEAHVFAEANRFLSTFDSLSRPEDQNIPLILKANEPFNPQNPSFSIYGVRENGTLVLKSPEWNYDYKRSHHYQNFLDAEKEFKEGSLMMNIWRHIPGIDSHIIHKMVKMRDDYSDNKNAKDYFIKNVNRVSKAYHIVMGTQYDYEPLIVDLTDDDFEILMRSIANLGMYQ